MEKKVMLRQIERLHDLAERSLARDEAEQAQILNEYAVQIATVFDVTDDYSYSDSNVVQFRTRRKAA